MVHIFKKIRNNHRLYIKDGYGCWVSKGEPSAENSFLLSILPLVWDNLFDLHLFDGLPAIFGHYGSKLKISCQF